MPHYAEKARVGLSLTKSLGDGYTINLKWFQAYPDLYTNQIAYHVYFADFRENVFWEGVKYVIIDPNATEANIIGLTPGKEYFFCIRPVEYDPTMFDLSTLPVAYDNVRYYPSSLLRQDITATSLIIPLLDVECFPQTGIIRIGAELIQYLAVDIINDNLIVPAPGEPINGSLVLQPDGYYYQPSSDNIGDGTISNLSLIGYSPDQTWTVKCIWVRTDLSGNIIPNYAKFIVTGSVSGDVLDGYGNYIVWSSDGTVNNNTILSFSISEGIVPFNVSDSFTMVVAGSVPATAGGRGYNNTFATLHNIDGYNGYHYFNPMVSIFTPGESLSFDNIYVCLCRFEYPHFPFTILDGYKQVTIDYLSTNYAAADAANVTFPMYDYSGWHRTDPVQLLNGVCVGSYIGGEMGCIDAFGNYNIYRGFSLQEQNTQRQDILLSVDGQSACLIRRVQTGDVCSCYLSTSEYPDDRCPFCWGTKYVYGFEQYFDPRHSDGRIKVRLSPTSENLRMHEAGLESEFPLDMWTLTVPTIKTRDVIILFDQDDNESFRYEVGDVTRNQTILGLDGGQHMKTFRIRKTDPAYQIRVFRDTSDFPQTINTSLGFTPTIPPHSHTIQVSEKILAVSQINQTTGVSQGHQHVVVNGKVLPILGHHHSIILP
jgi:hypothetical protein